MKLPNKFGSIVKLAGNRRKPYAVRKHGKYLAYFSNYEDALIFLAEHSKQPDIYSAEQTFGEIFKLDMAERRKRISDKTINGYVSASHHCQTIWDKRVKDLRVADLQGVITDISKTVGQPTQKKVRQIMHNVYRYAVKYQFISSTADISHYIDIDILKRKYKKSPFNTRQINRVKAIADSDHELAPWAKCVVMMCYCGTRPSEFIAIQKQDVKLRQRYFIVRDSKTEAGRNRLVPISRKALPFFEWWLQQPGKTLVSDAYGQPIPYRKYRKLFARIMAASRCKHTPHECRHTCATWLDNAGANDLAIKRILGHAAHGVTQKVYTHKSLAQLRKAIDLL